MKISIAEQLAKKAFFRGIELAKNSQSLTPQLDEAIFKDWWLKEKKNQLDNWINDPRNPWNPKYGKKHA